MSKNLDSIVEAIKHVEGKELFAQAPQVLHHEGAQQVSSIVHSCLRYGCNNDWMHFRSSYLRKWWAAPWTPGRPWPPRREGTSSLLKSEKRIDCDWNQQVTYSTHTHTIIDGSIELYYTNLVCAAIAAAFCVHKIPRFNICNKTICHHMSNIIGE